MFNLIDGYLPPNHAWAKAADIRKRTPNVPFATTHPITAERRGEGCAIVFSTFGWCRRITEWYAVNVIVCLVIFCFTFQVECIFGFSRQVNGSCSCQLCPSNLSVVATKTKPVLGEMVVLVATGIFFFNNDRYHAHHSLPSTQWTIPDAPYWTDHV